MNDWPAAHAACLSRLRSDPADATAFAALAAIAEAHGNLSRAADLLAQASAGDLRAPSHLIHRARLLVQLSRPDEAGPVADAALALPIASAALLDMLGVVLSRLDRHGEAAALFLRAAERDPGSAPIWRHLGLAEQFCGRFGEAESAYRRALAIAPDDAATWLALVGLRRQTPADDPAPALEALWARRGDDPDRALRIGHALSKVAEDLGRSDAAMRWLAEAKREKARVVAHDPDATDRLYAAAAATLDAPAGPGLGGPAPILVVGAPRTGTTLVERILSSHSAVRSVGESPALSLGVKRLSGTRTNRVLDEETLVAARGIDPSALGRVYLDALGGEGGRTVDKMPLNLLLAGLAHRALPDARIVRLRRHPMDTVLANWRQLFAPRPGHYDHNWSLEHLARWVVALERLAAHWRAVLPPDRYTELRYEALVAAPEAETRRLLGFCGLPWEDRCLAFHANATPTATASSVQVRERVHTRSVGRWRRVRDHLEPAARILRAAGLIDAGGEAAPDQP